MANDLVSYMLKRPLNKSYFPNNNAYKGRWFVLSPPHLSYYEGGPDGSPTRMKNQINIDNIKVIERVDDKEEFVGRANVFQIVFDEGKETYILYVIACTSEQQNTWINRLRDVLTERNIHLNERYHPKAYSYSQKQFTCCQALGINRTGCKVSAYQQTFPLSPAPTPPSPAPTPPAPTVSPPPIPTNVDPNQHSGGRGREVAPLLPARRVPVNLPKPVLYRVIAIYDLEAGNPDELAIVKGEIYGIIDESEQTWLFARDKYEKEGYIPASYVQRVTDMGLEQFDWYYKDISRARAEQLVREGGVEGTFLVRDSTTSPGLHTLIMFASDPSDPEGIVKLYHINRDSKGKFYVSKLHAFDTVLDLIQFHKTNRSGLVCCLQKPPGGGRSNLKPVTASLGHDVWEVNRKELQLAEVLKDGKFGVVRKAIWKSARGAKTVVVAVKSVKDGLLNEDNFANEAEMLKSLQHPNLVQLYGVCTTQRPFYIITEFLANGSLLDFLKRNKSSLRGHTPTIVDMCMQVCCAMEYLELKCFIHRSLSANNCLVGENNVVKVGDFALARFVAENEYMSSNMDVSIRWAAPEVLTLLQYSSKSDVWAYGVVMWEMFSFGDIPYSSKSEDDVASAVTNRKLRLACPNGCPQGIFKLMRLCWRTAADDRPTFSQLSVTLFSMQDNGVFDI